MCEGVCQKNQSSSPNDAPAIQRLVELPRRPQVHDYSRLLPSVQHVELAVRGVGVVPARPLDYGSPERLCEVEGVEEDGLGRVEAEGVFGYGLFAGCLSLLLSHQFRARLDDNWLLARRLAAQRGIVGGGMWLLLELGGEGVCGGGLRGMCGLVEGERVGDLVVADAVAHPYYQLLHRLLMRQGLIPPPSEFPIGIKRNSVARIQWLRE